MLSAPSVRLFHPITVARLSLRVALGAGEIPETTRCDCLSIGSRVVSAAFVVTWQRPTKGFLQSLTAFCECQERLFEIRKVNLIPQVAYRFFSFTVVLPSAAFSAGFSSSSALRTASVNRKSVVFVPIPARLFSHWLSAVVFTDFPQYDLRLKSLNSVQDA